MYVTFTGYVIDWSNHPVTKAQIICDANNVTTLTDDNGKYLLSLEAGSHLVRFFFKIEIKNIYLLGYILDHGLCKGIRNFN